MVSDPYGYAFMTHVLHQRLENSLHVKKEVLLVLGVGLFLSLFIFEAGARFVW